MNEVIYVTLNAIEEFLTQFCQDFIEMDEKLTRYLKLSKLQFVAVKNKFANSQLFANRDSSTNCTTRKRTLL